MQAKRHKCRARDNNSCVLAVASEQSSSEGQLCKFVSKKTLWLKNPSSLTSSPESPLYKGFLVCEGLFSSLTYPSHIPHEIKSQKALSCQGVSAYSLLPQATRVDFHFYFHFNSESSIVYSKNYFATKSYISYTFAITI